MAEDMRTLIQEKARTAVCDNANAPVRYFYSNDATSLKVRASVMAGGTHEQKNVKRVGFKLEEFLVERGIIKHFNGAGTVEMCVLMSDPRPLRDGKGAWESWAASCKFFPMLRSLGHKSIAITHVCFDRLLLSSQARLLCAQHTCHHELVVGDGDGANALLHELDWLTAVGCAAHDMCNGIKWGMQYHTTEQSAKDLYIVLESLRNSLLDISSYSIVFLASHVTYHDPEDHQLVQEFWLLMGIEPDWLDDFTSIDPIWRDGSLQVSRESEQDPALGEKLRAMHMYALKWKTFSATRWGGVGFPCRGILRSIVVGLERLIHETRQVEGVSDYHLHGFERCTSKIKRFALVAGISSYVGEAFVMDVLEDDRVALHAQKYKANLQDEVQYVEHVSEFAWKRLQDSVMCGECQWHELRDESLLSAHTQIAFVQMRVFDVAESPPFSLASGDCKKKPHRSQQWPNASR